MSTIKIDFDVRVIGDRDYIPFEQVIKLLHNLNKHAPNLDLSEIAKALESQRNHARQNI